MFQNVIIGIDEQDAHRDAVRLGQELVARGGTLTLAHIHAGIPLFGSGSRSGTRSERAEDERAGQLLATVRGESGITSAITIGVSSVGRGLHQLAEHRGADLLVVGSTRRGLPGRVLMGDDTSEAIDGSRCAVAVAPAGYAEHTVGFNEIGVAYNETSESRHALTVARELAGNHRARVSALEAISLPPFLPSGIGVPYQEIADSWLCATQDRLKLLEDVETHVVFGDPAEELALYSASLDLLVVGSRDFGPIGRLMHSSVSRRLSRTARCPLLILTRASYERASDEHPSASVHA